MPTQCNKYLMFALGLMLLSAVQSSMVTCHGPSLQPDPKLLLPHMCVNPSIPIVQRGALSNRRLPTLTIPSPGKAEHCEEKDGAPRDEGREERIAGSGGW